MNKQISILSEKYDRLMGSPFLSFTEVAALKNKMGVYVIYEDNHIIYIGKTNKFHIRFGTDLKHESTHTLFKKLIKIEKCKDRLDVVNFLNTKCRYRIEFCDENREAEALEAIAIHILNPQLNRR
jgi:hypothetical protein